MFAACGWESAAPIARPITLSLTTDLGCPPTPDVGHQARCCSVAWVRGSPYPFGGPRVAWRGTHVERSPVSLPSRATGRHGTSMSPPMIAARRRSIPALIEARAPDRERGSPQPEQGRGSQASCPGSCKGADSAVLFFPGGLVLNALFTPSPCSRAMTWRFVVWTGVERPLAFPPRNSWSACVTCPQGESRRPRDVRKSPGRWAFSARWSWGESNPRPSAGGRTRYDRSRLRGCRCLTGGSAGGPRAVTNAWSFPGVSRLSGRQWSFPPSSSASVAGLRRTGPVWHCCSR